MTDYLTENDDGGIKISPNTSTMTIDSPGWIVPKWSVPILGLFVFGGGFVAGAIFMLFTIASG